MEKKTEKFGLAKNLPRRQAGDSNISERRREPQSRRGEPYEVMLRRFFRDVQQSGILTEIKRRKFREKEPSREKIRQSARRKAERRKIKRGY